MRLCLLLCCLSLPALAQTAVRREPDTTVVRPRTEVSFTEGEVTGTHHTPEGSTVTGRRPARRFESLLKVRGHFQKELQESAGQL